MTTARLSYRGGNEEYKFSKENFFKDLKLSFTIILFAEMGFCATSVPFLGHQFLTNPHKISLQNVGSSSATVAIGGIFGFIPYHFMPEMKKERELVLLSNQC